MGHWGYVDKMFVRGKRYKWCKSLWGKKIGVLSTYSLSLLLLLLFIYKLIEEGENL
jgi:hypothetical protein